MSPVVLKAAFERLIADAPDFTRYSPYSHPHLKWLGRAQALVSRWDEVEAIAFDSAISYLNIQSLRDAQVGKIFAAIYHAIADLELKSEKLGAQAFGPGAVYDFFQALRNAVALCSTSLFVIDPYLDATIFDTYLSELPIAVSARLLCRKHAENVGNAASLFRTQNSATIEVRASKDIHDRVIFADNAAWVLGQSIKDAAVKSPTYLAPLSEDVGALKLEQYEIVWRAATPL